MLGRLRYNGAIRLYWAGASDYADPFEHPLWTATKLMARAKSTDHAAKRIRHVILGRVMGVACFTVREPGIFGSIRAAARREDTERRLATAKGATSLEELVRDLDKDNQRLESDKEQLKAENDTLRAELNKSRSRIAMLEAGERPGDVSPEKRTPPETVAEAVATARRVHGEYLVFGGDVERGVGTLASSAGPPERILDWLGRLAEAASLKRSGGLGKDVIVWLKDNGVRASGESDTVKKSRKEREKRTWSDGKGRRLFDFHMKPKDGTSPDQCVRIYFDWDDSRKVYVVGWVGRHLE